MDSLEILGQALECSVCLEQLGCSSRVLPCQHTFCHSCLDDIARSHKELRCPECRTLVTIPLKDLPTNILLMRILEGMKSHPNTGVNGPQRTTPQTSRIHPSSQDSPKNNAIQSPNYLSMQSFRSHSFSGSAAPGNNSHLCEQGRHSISQANISPSSTASSCSTVDSSPLSFMNPLSLSLPDATSRTNTQSHSGPNLVMDNNIYGAVYDPVSTSTVPQTIEGNPFMEMMKSESSDAIPDLVTKKMAVALYSYNRKESRDLSFQKGDIITVHKKIDQNWYQGELNGDLGFFPASYVQVEDGPQCTALYNFHQDTQAGKCLRFSKGDTIDVLRRLDSNWIEGKLANEVGIVPLCFVSLNNAAKNLLKNSSETLSDPAPHVPETAQPTQTNNTSSSLLATPNAKEPCTLAPSPPPRTKTVEDSLYVCVHPYEAHKADEIRLSRGSIYYVNEKFNDGWFRGRSLSTGAEGVFPGNYLKPLRSDPNTSTSSVNVSPANPKVQTECSPRPPALMPRTTAASLKSTKKEVTTEDTKWGVHRPKFMANKKSSSVASKDSSKEPQSFVTQGWKRERPNSHRTMPLVKERFRCVVPYPPSSPAELALQTGDIVYVHTKLQDGWYKGTMQRSGQVGLFPSSFVEPC